VENKLSFLGFLGIKLPILKKHAIMKNLGINSNTVFFGGSREL
jgi:hypothetical protein